MIVYLLHVIVVKQMDNQVIRHYIRAIKVSRTQLHEREL